MKTTLCTSIITVLCTIASAFATTEKKPSETPPTRAQMVAFRSGDIREFSKHIGNNPIIMVSVFKRDLRMPTAPNGQPHPVVIATSFARVVLSCSPDFEVGDLVAFYQSRENPSPIELYHFSHPEGELYYLIHPVTGMTMSSVHYLNEGRDFIPVRSFRYYCPAYYQE